MFKDCSTLNLECTSQGCLACEPNSLKCQGAQLLRCNDKGTGYLAKAELTCDASKGMICNNDSCINACELARINRSYVGCEYWAVDLDNAVVESGNAASQQFAVALSNPSQLAATIKVLINEAPLGEPVQLKELETRKIDPRQLELVLLPSREVDGSSPGTFDTGGGTAITSNAYKIESSVPIIAYQFNPLSNVGVFSNDASLLIPTPALTMDASASTGAPYVVMGWPQTIATTKDPKTNFGDDLRAFLTIVGTRSETQIKVTLSTDIVGDKERHIPALKKGQVLDFKLNPFDVLNIESEGFRADFTGTRITSNKPVAVFSGSEASDVPDFSDLTKRKCCADHLEQQIFPSTTLGTIFVALTTPSRTKALLEAGAVITEKREKEYFRVLATGEFTTVTTNLPAPDDRFTLGYGQFAQLAVDRDFTIQANEPLVLGQFVAGQEECGIPSTLPGGDPSFILLPPVEQFRKDYLFLTPNKYVFDFILIAAPREARLTLDNRPLKKGCDVAAGRKICCEVSDVGKITNVAKSSETDFVAYKCQLSFPTIMPNQNPPQNLLEGEQNDGVHWLAASEKVGLVVYGFDGYVTYGYPGGTDLALINLR